MDGFTYYNNNVNNSENDYEINEDEYLSFSLDMLSDDIKNFGKIKEIYSMEELYDKNYRNYTFNNVGCSERIHIL